ncbi:MAG: glycosyltransferase family 4 protein [Endomicrobia bacterium]|nr:glycosyltransferase family 4 protein [Endomicrobiia bacterium]
MKVGIDGRELEKNKLTGIGRFLLAFLSKAVELKNTYEFFVFLNQNCELHLYSDNLTKIFLYEKSKFFFDQVQLLSAAKRYKIDLFFSPYYKFPILLDIPVITTVFDVIYLMVEPYKNKFKNNFYIKNFIKFTSKKVKTIITCSNTAKKDIIKLTDIDEEKIKVIYLAVDEKFTSQPENKIIQIKRKYNINTKYLLYVGNSNPHKNLNRLILAYDMLPGEIKSQYTLVLAGVQKKDILKYFFSIPDWLHIIEFVDDDDLPALYSGAELFVFPSLYEGFGLPPVEALACGCPVVASNVSSIPEILKEAAVYFDPYNIEDIKDKILKVLCSDSLKNSLFTSGIKHAKEFNKENMVKSILKIFDLALMS